MAAALLDAAHAAKYVRAPSLRKTIPVAVIRASVIQDMSRSRAVTASAAVTFLLTLAACASPRTVAAPPAPAPLPVESSLVLTSPETVGMSNALPEQLDSIVTAAIADRASPGVAIMIGRHGRLVVDRSWGRSDWAPNAPPVTDSTLYDMASLTKVIASTTAAMLLEEDSLLDIERTVVSYLPEFNSPDKSGITVRMLLTHSSGMKQNRPLWREFKTHAEFLRAINSHPLSYVPGERSDYTDWNMMVLQAIVERLSGKRLDSLLAERVFGPLGMRETGFNPSGGLKARIAPTEIQDFRGGLVWGVVHDENAWMLGGVSGHAGLFSSARDLATFAQMMLNGGEFGGVRVLQPQTIARWTARQRKDGSRALGWDTPAPRSSAGRYFSTRSWGHTGFTGTSIWVDPEKQLFVVLLTNRVNPTRDNRRVDPLRRSVADAAQAAVLDALLRRWEGPAPR
ncbi:MAG TPA: serine hydrolase domain-containing protein [Gemmatimonadaceae bacterium]|nr:serine hydrolase domain-containing protein [Gemmatimonadaceae bacterium]